MTLVFLYGPPAVGKLTVGKALAKRTGYTLFHNHLTADVVEKIIPRGTPNFGRAVRKIRYDLIDVAARSNITGLIFTFVYLHPKDIAEVRRYITSVRRGGGRMLFVRLTTSEKVLHHRVTKASRKSFGKITSHAMLAGVLKRHDLTSAIPHVRSLVIDTTNIPPTIAAQKIQRHYKLSKKKL